MRMIKLGRYEVPFHGWKADSKPLGRIVALDTETTLIRDGLVPDLVIACATDGQNGYYLTNQQVVPFLKACAPETVFIMHNAAFDLAVLKKVGADFDFGHVLDTGLLYKLLLLADTGDCNGLWSLDHLAQKFLQVTVAKDVKGPNGENVRTSFETFLNPDGTVDALRLAKTGDGVYLEYAAKDPIATWHIAQALNQWAQRLFNGIDLFNPQTYSVCGLVDGTDLKTAWQRHGFMTHDIQLKASVALSQVERHGMCLDPDQVQACVKGLEQDLDLVLGKLKAFGWQPGTGSHKALNAALKAFEASSEERLTRRESGEYSHKGEDLEEFRHQSEFIDAYLTYEELHKLHSTFVLKLKHADKHVRGRFNVLVNTGRTSCSSYTNDEDKQEGLNLQNLPKPKKGSTCIPVRECFVPSPGHLFLNADYSTVELCTLAQHCFKKYGHSKMAEALQKHADLHCVYALLREGRKLGDFKSLDKKTLMAELGPDAKEKRDKAKPVNFGFAGGLGPKTFVKYARSTYDVAVTEAEASEEKAHYKAAFPEMNRHLASDDLQMLADSYMGLWMKHPGAFPFQPKPGEVPWPIHNFKGIISGRTHTKSGKPYTAEQIQWAKECANVIVDSLGHLKPADKNTLMTKIKEGLFGDELRNALTPRQRYVSTLTGRLRGSPTYCAARNTPFQGLAADGAKLALYRLVAEDFRVVNFIHDEFLIEVPESADQTAWARQVEQILIEEMQRVVPDIPIKVEYALMRRWYKGAEACFQDGILLPSKPVVKDGKTIWIPDREEVIEVK